MRSSIYFLDIEKLQMRARERQSILDHIKTEYNQLKTEREELMIGNHFVFYNDNHYHLYYFLLIYLFIHALFHPLMLPLGTSC